MDLNKYSREGTPKHDVRLGGRLHDSALGSIYVAHVNSEKALILKSINLQDQNLFAVTVGQKRTTLRGLEASKIEYLTDSKTEAHEWLDTWKCSDDSALVAKVCWVDGPLARDGATKVKLCNEYLNEVMVGLIVSKIKVPHFIKTQDAWIQNAKGYILQDYGGTTLIKKMLSLSFTEFKSVLLQVILAIAIGQTQAHLKHHDMHLENVFITELKDIEHQGVPLKSKDSWSYSTHGTTLYVPQCGVLALIGDFGLASATDNGTRYERLDMPLLDQGEADWGQWTGQLQEAYDVLTFLSFFYLEEESSMCQKSHADWARSIYDAICKASPTPVRCSLRGRPMRNCHGEGLTMAAILALPVFDEFKVQRDSVRII